jgi:F plasmid transfer operon, TraF, protein
VFTVVAALTLLATPPKVSAQAFEVVGTRALGMGGAFVAVADDATATYWNPAGLGFGPVVDLVIERQAFDALPDGRDRPLEATTRAAQGSSTVFALVTPPLGLSYYRIRTTVVPAGPAASTAVDGQSDRSGGIVASTLVTRHFGVTLVQSLTSHLILGTTLKMVRGTAGQHVFDTSGGTVEDALDAAGDLDGQVHTTVDLDAGLLAAIGPWRLGLTGRNLRQPEFPVFPPDGPPGESLRLARQVRAGLAFAPRSRPTGTNGPLTVAADMDFRVAETAFGRRREMAIGGERWWLGGQAAIRAGIRFNTLREAGQEGDPVIAGGFSVRVRSRSLIEGHISCGSKGLERSWGLAARVTF